MNYGCCLVPRSRSSPHRGAKANARTHTAFYFVYYEAFRIDSSIEKRIETSPTLSPCRVRPRQMRRKWTNVLVQLANYEASSAGQACFFFCFLFCFLFFMSLNPHLLPVRGNLLPGHSLPASDNSPTFAFLMRLIIPPRITLSATYFTIRQAASLLVSLFF